MWSIHSMRMRKFHSQRATDPPDHPLSFFSDLVTRLTVCTLGLTWLTCFIWGNSHWNTCIFTQANWVSYKRHTSVREFYLRMCSKKSISKANKQCFSILSYSAKAHGNKADRTVTIAKWFSSYDTRLSYLCILECVIHTVMFSFRSGSLCLLE